MNITVIQFRTDQSGPHEVKCLFNSCGLPYQSFTFINALNDSFLNNVNKLKKNTDVWILTGWGEAGYESQDEDGKKKLTIVKQRLYPLIRELYSQKVSLIGICFGFQIMVDALGGSLAIEPKMSEGGIFDVFLTEKGAKEKIFAGMETPFKAVLGHKTSVVSLPKGVVRLAYSKKCPIQAAKFGKYSYGFTFHPELIHKDIIERTSLYDGYISDQSTMEYSEIGTAKILQNLFSEYLINNNSMKGSTFSALSI